MDTNIIFITVGIVIFIGFLAELLFKRTNIPDVLILIFIGIIIKVFFGIQPLQDSVIAELFITFALLYVLFQGALKIQLKKLLKSMTTATKLTLANFFLSVAGIMGILIVFGFAWEISLLMGTILGGTSAIVTVPILQNIVLKEKYSSSLMLESAFSDVLCIVGSLAVLGFIQTGIMAPETLFQSALVSISLGVGSGVFAGILWTLLLTKFKSLSQAYMVTIGALLILYSLVQTPWIGGSGALACLAFGIVVGNSKQFLSFFQKPSDDETVHPVFDHSALSFYSEISFLLKVVFFVYLGMLIDFTSISIIMMGLVITVVLFFIRPMVIYTAFIKDKPSVTERTILEVMVPKGLAAAVLAQLISLQLSEYVEFASIAGMLGNLALSVVFFSIILTSILVFVTEKNWFGGLYHPLKRDILVEKK